MMLIEETTIPGAALPLATFRAHLRMGTGFGTGSLQEDLLLGFLRGAVVAIEGRLSKALLTRTFTLTVTDWRRRDQFTFPIGPVRSVSAVTMIDGNGQENSLDESCYWLDQGGLDAVLRADQGAFPKIPTRGSARIRFVAGMAEDGDSLPADLKQAVMMLAAHYYEYRDDTSLGEGCMPFGVTSLIQRYLPLRLGVGADL